MKIIFPVYKGRAECTFDCPCGAKKRKRSFTVEHTVNPYNTNPDGMQKPPAQVSQEARFAALLERDQFLTAPLCKRCEDALTFLERKTISEKRRLIAGQNR